MTKTNLKLSFKGDRTYGHGTDMFDGLCALITNELGLDAPQSLLFAVPRMSSQNLSVELKKKAEPAGDPPPVAQLTFLSRGEYWRLSAREDGTPIEGRRPYDEAPVATNSNVDQSTQTIRLTKPLDYSDIELWTAMNKVLMQTCFPERKGKWLFVKCEIDRYSLRTPYEAVELRLKSNFHFKLTQTEILVNNASRGSIYFSLT